MPWATGSLGSVTELVLVLAVMLSLACMLGLGRDGVCVDCGGRGGHRPGCRKSRP